MGSSSGASSGSSGELQQHQQEALVMEQRKRKRMISNRESARRSRMRKQKHLDDLMGQVGQLRRENQEIISTINVTSQYLMRVEAENSVLRAQVRELSHRLKALNEIISFSSYSTNNDDGFYNNSNNDYNMMGFLNQQPIMASADVFHF